MSPKVVPFVHVIARWWGPSRDEAASIPRMQVVEEVLDVGEPGKSGRPLQIVTRYRIVMPRLQNGCGAASPLGWRSLPDPGIE